MRVLIVNSMFASAVYRECANALGLIPGVELTMLTVDEWKMNGRPMRFDALDANAPFATVIGKASWRGYENRGFYRSGIVRAFLLSRPDVLFIMEEPFSVFAAEILLLKTLLAPSIPVVFFTWNNLSFSQFDYRPSFFYRNVSRFTLQRMDYALTANLAGVQVLHDASFFKPIKTVGYGVDTKRYSISSESARNAIRESLNISPDVMVIAYVGRMLDMKGVDLLIEAFAMLRKKHKTKKTILLLLGSGEAEQSLMDLVKKNDLLSDVRHIPSVPHQDVPNYMQALDILVLPSRRKGMWAEQFGRVLVEAMAAGKIVIGSSSGAIPEVIGDGGFIFPENDSNALADCLIQSLSLNAEEMGLLKIRAAARAQYFSWQRFAQDAYDALSYCYRKEGVSK